MLVANGLLIEQQEMVVRALHGVHPEVVTHFQMLSDFFARHAHYVELVLIFIEIEHVAHTDWTGFQNRVELKGSVERNVGFCNLQLEVEDEIVEGRTAEELVAAVDGSLEVANLLAHIFLYFRNLRFESLHEILVDRTICHIHNLACHLFVSYHQLFLSVHLFLVEGEGYFSISHANGVVGRIQANHLLSLCVGNGFVVARMVVTEENQVEARHFFCHLDRGVFIILCSLNASVFSAMEEADDDIRFLIFLKIFHPFAGVCYHILKFQSAPEILREPVWNGRSEHSQDSHLHAFAVQDKVRLDIRLTCRSADDVGTQDWAVEFFYPFVVNRMTRLNIMISKYLRIILHVVYHIGSHVSCLCIYIIIIIAGRLTLQNVAIFQEDEIILVVFTQIVDVGRNARQGSCFRLTVDEIVREERAVHIACLYHSQFYGTLLCHRL